MQWLRLAMQAAQRRYKLTNLLLLILRCLAILLLVFGLSRPSLASLGQGTDLVLVVDVSSSMGPVGTDPGALAEAVRGIKAEAPSAKRITIVSLADRVRLDGPLNQARLEATLDTLAPATMPGGLDDAVTRGHIDQILSVCKPESDVVLISDFRQDRGEKLSAALRPAVRSLRRWQVGRDSPNATITGISNLDDLIPGAAGSLDLTFFGGPQAVRLAIDDGIPIPIALSPGQTRIPLPPLSPGRHTVQATIVDNSLAADNTLAIPVEVRGAISCLVVERSRSFLGTSLEASRSQCVVERLSPSGLAAKPLPQQGAVILRAPIVGVPGLAQWVEQGGLLWGSFADLSASPDLAPLLSKVKRGDIPENGGTIASPDPDLNPSLRRAELASLHPLSSNDAATKNLLFAGKIPLVRAIPLGKGSIVIEAEPLESIPNLMRAGAWPEWAVRNLRTLTQAATIPESFEAGTPTPRALSLSSQGRRLDFVKSAPLLAAPGIWKEILPNGQERECLITHNRQEARLAGERSSDLLRESSQVFPKDRGSDWSLFLFIGLLAILLIEGALAAWGGRTYGR
jgi:hypothetical protein